MVTLDPSRQGRDVGVPSGSTCVPARSARSSHQIVGRHQHLPHGARIPARPGVCRGYSIGVQPVGNLGGRISRCQSRWRAARASDTNWWSASQSANWMPIRRTVRVDAQGATATESGGLAHVGYLARVRWVTFHVSGFVLVSLHGLHHHGELAESAVGLIRTCNEAANGRTEEVIRSELPHPGYGSWQRRSDQTRRDEGARLQPCLRRLRSCLRSRRLRGCWSYPERLETLRRRSMVQVVQPTMGAHRGARSLWQGLLGHPRQVGVLPPSWANLGPSRLPLACSATRGCPRVSDCPGLLSLNPAANEPGRGYRHPSDPTRLT